MHVEMAGTLIFRTHNPENIVEFELYSFRSLIVSETP